VVPRLGASRLRATAGDTRPVPEARANSVSLYYEEHGAGSRSWASTAPGLAAAPAIVIGCSYGGRGGDRPSRYLIDPAHPVVLAFVDEVLARA
jgi:hypothetical protein